MVESCFICNFRNSVIFIRVVFLILEVLKEFVLNFMFEITFFHPVKIGLTLVCKENKCYLERLDTCGYVCLFVFNLF